MKKVKKATKAELKSIHDVNEKVNQEIFNLGLLEDKKVDHLQKLQSHRIELGKVQKVLEEKYGKVVIDLTNGEITDQQSETD
tara:strand:+ start:118 stop:363 length:246 start_codon:yes stop_codon:yes gene_type:complete